MLGACLNLMIFIRHPLSQFPLPFISYARGFRIADTNYSYSPPQTSHYRLTAPISLLRPLVARAHSDRARSASRRTTRLPPLFFLEGPSPHTMKGSASPHRPRLAFFFRTPEFLSLLVKILPFPHSAFRLLKHLANGRVDRGWERRWIQNDATSRNNRSPITIGT